MLTAAGVVTGLAATLDGTVAALAAGRLAIGPLHGLDGWGLPGQLGAPLGPPDPGLVGVTPRDAWILGRPGLALLQAGVAALARRTAGEAPPPEQVGAFGALGTVDPRGEDLAAAVAASRVGGAVDAAAFLSGGFREIHPLWPLATLANVAFSLVCSRLGAAGDNAVLVGGADAGVAALAEGVDSVLCGRSRRALVGGAAEALSPWQLARARAASWLGEAPASGAVPACPPGEGAAVLVLEPEGVAGGALGVVAGWGQGHTPEEACTRALARAGGPPPDLVVAHADGTAAGEAGERALLERLGQAALAAPSRALGHLGPAGPLLALALAARWLGGEPLPPGATPVRPPRRALVLARGSARWAAAILDAVG